VEPKETTQKTLEKNMHKIRAKPNGPDALGHSIHLSVDINIWTEA
jgi:hypothetical protein